jgi:hypothetical protein
VCGCVGIDQSSLAQKSHHKMKRDSRQQSCTYTRDASIAPSFICKVPHCCIYLRVTVHALAFAPICHHDGMCTHVQLITYSHSVGAWRDRDHHQRTTAFPPRASRLLHRRNMRHTWTGCRNATGSMRFPCLAAISICAHWCTTCLCTRIACVAIMIA